MTVHAILAVASLAISLACLVGVIAVGVSVARTWAEWRKLPRIKPTPHVRMH